MDRSRGGLDASKLSSSALSSAGAPHQAGDATLLDGAHVPASSPWGGDVSPSPAIRPHRAGRLPYPVTTPHRRLSRRAWLPEAGTHREETAAGAESVAPTVYARHYMPLYANQPHKPLRSEAAPTTTTSTPDSTTDGRRPRDDLSASTVSSSSPSWSAGSADRTQVITRRYRQLRAAWEEWHGVMAVVGPQQFSTLLAQAHAQQQQQRRDQLNAGLDSTHGQQAMLPVIRRLYNRLQRTWLSASPRARRQQRRRQRQRTRVQADQGLQWPRTQVDGLSVLHVQLARWCREELIPYLMNKASAIVAPASLPLSRSRSSGLSAGSRSVDEASKVEVLFPHGGTSSSDTAPAPPLTDTPASLAHSTDSMTDETDETDEEDAWDLRDAMTLFGAEGEGASTPPLHEAAAATAAAATGAPAPPAFLTLAWMRGVGRPTSHAARPTAKADHHVPANGFLHRLLARLGRRRSSAATPHKPRRYRRARDVQDRGLLSALDQAVLGQVRQLVPSLWEQPLTEAMEATLASTESAACMAAAASAAAAMATTRGGLGFAPYAPLSDLSHAAALAALELSLTPTTNTQLTSTGSHVQSNSTSTGGGDVSSTRVSGEQDHAHHTEPVHTVSAEARLRRSLAALDACTARHHAARTSEKHHAGHDTITLTTTTADGNDDDKAPVRTASVSSLPSSACADRAAVDESGQRHGRSARSALFSASHDAMHLLPRRRIFHHPAPRALPHWQADHEVYMTRCLQDAVSLAHLAHPTQPYWQDARSAATDAPVPGVEEEEEEGVMAVPEAEKRVRGVFDRATTAFCEAFAATAVQRVLDHHHGAADRANSEWLLRRLSQLVSEKLAAVASARPAGSPDPKAADMAGNGVLACIRRGTPVSLGALVLSEEDRQALADVRAKANSTDTAVSLRTSGYTVTYSQLASLRPRTWLNDQIINNYLQLLCECEAERHGGVEGVVSMGSHFYSKVQSELEMLRASSAAPGERRGHPAAALALPPLPAANTLLRWLRRRRHILLPYGAAASPPTASATEALPDTTTVHTLLIPVNLSGQHWALVVARKSRLASPVPGRTAHTMTWTFYDSLCPSSGRHPRGQRILRELRHVLSECERHLVQPSLLSEATTAAKAASASAVRGACRIALPFQPSENFSLELGVKRPFASLDALNTAEATLRARVEARETQPPHSAHPRTPKPALSAAQAETARRARLRGVAEDLVHATQMPVAELLRRYGQTSDPQSGAGSAGGSEGVEDDGGDDDDNSACASDVDMGEELDNREVEWFTRGDAHVPQQQNSYDCGVFVCQVAWCAVEDIAVSFSQSEDVVRLREVITLELLAKKIMRRLPTTHMSSTMNVNVFTAPDSSLPPAH